MTIEIITTALTGVGVVLAVWRILVHYETRNDLAHAELRATIADNQKANNEAHAELRRAIETFGATLVKVAEDVAYMRGRQDERDRQEERDRGGS